MLLKYASPSSPWEAHALMASRISPLILFGFACLTLVSGGKNITIDDYYGDPFNGFHPLYTPVEKWSLGPYCTGCASRPQVAYAYDRTWHDSTYTGNSTQIDLVIPFNGTAIYVYCILDNTDSNYTRFTYLSFSLDNQPVGSYSHTPDQNYPYDQPSFQYNVLVYGNDTLENGLHNVTVTVGGSGRHSLMLFDYAVYTYEGALAGSPSKAPSESLPSSTAPSVITKPSNKDAVIVGTVLGGVLLLCFAGMAVYIWRRKQGIKPASSMWRFSLVKPRSSCDGFSMSESTLNAGKTPYSNPIRGRAKRPCSSDVTARYKRLVGYPYA